MKNREEKRREILKRLNAGATEANSDPAEEERQRRIKNEIEIEKEIDRGWFARRFGAGG